MRAGRTARSRSLHGIAKATQSTVVNHNVYICVSWWSLGLLMEMMFYPTGVETHRLRNIAQDTSMLWLWLGQAPLSSPIPASSPMALPCQSFVSSSIKSRQWHLLFCELCGFGTWQASVSVSLPSGLECFHLHLPQEHCHFLGVVNLNYL